MTSEAMDKITRAVEAALERAGLLRAGTRLIAAVSGGADSVALLLALCKARERHPFELIACHVQHGLRGVSSLADERFTRELCERLGVPLAVRNAALKGDMHDAGAETRARDERLRIFDELMREEHADALLLAHHMNDQAETALMRLMRGAGAAGLRAMPERKPFSRGMALRPLLSVEKRTIKAALESVRQGWREDESNQDPCTPRNALRLKILPALEALYPDAQAHIANASEALNADEDCLSALADTLYEQAVLCAAGILALDAQALRVAHEALRRRAVRRLYTHGVTLAGLSPDERALSHSDTLRLAALAAAQSGEAVNLPCGLMAVRGRRHIHLTRQGGEPIKPATEAQPVAISADIERYETPLAAIRLEAVAVGDAPPKNASSVWLPADALGEAALRAPKEGDVIRPFGASGSKPLRRYLTDRKLDMPFRRALPVLAKGSRIIWIPGLCSSEELRASAGAEAGRYIRLSLEGEAPYV